MDILVRINYIVSILFTVLYAYQLFYIPVAWLPKRKEKETADCPHDFAVMICARNEAYVIGELIDSIQSQDYDAGKVSVFVMADNCTDDTAKIAASKGACVFTRSDSERIGKGYALQELMKRIREKEPEGYDAYLVLDADNILSKGYLTAMNRSLSEGHEIITGYRNSKNYGDNWISAGYALWFLRESRYLNEARMKLRLSAAVSGTGFLFGRRIAEAIGDWPFHLLTEDIEFTIHEIVKGEKIACCREAELYDEQPVKFSQSWRQRLRWSKGYLQVFGKYWKELIKGIFSGNFSCYDMAMTTMPAFVLSLLTVVCNLFLGVRGAFMNEDVMIAVRSFLELLGNAYLFLFGIGFITALTEYRHIHASGMKIFLSLFTFPLFMFTYVPVSITALFSKVGWKPIEHRASGRNIAENTCKCRNKRIY